MKEMIQMVVVLTVLAVISGGSLAFMQDKTAASIENNKLQFIKGPAIKEILQGAANDPVADRFKLASDGVEHTFFVGVMDGQPKGVVFEGAGKGFGGDVGIVVGVDVETDKIIGVGVTTHVETPGVGSRAKTEPGFVAQFKGLSINDEFKVKNDGGQIDAIGGATVTSRAVTGGVTAAGKMYQALKSEIQKNAQAIKK
jgi:electron transport complex protein RnfG